MEEIKKKSNIICKYCKEKIWEMETPHGMDTHHTCKDCEAIEAAIWGEVF